MRKVSTNEVQQAERPGVWEKWPAEIHRIIALTRVVSEDLTFRITGESKSRTSSWKNWSIGYCSKADTQGKDRLTEV